jgi:D-2-hydroxyacid dehydrogenase (NADP+)
VRVLIVDEDHARLHAALAPQFPDVAFDAAADATAALPFCARATAIVALAHIVTAPMLEAATGLRWIQALTTGTDALMRLPNLGAGVVVTSARGVPSAAVSEFALMNMIALSRRFPEMLDQQRHNRWNRVRGQPIAGRTLTIVGVGSISEALASRAQACGMRVVGVSSGRTAVPGFDSIVPRTGLLDAVSGADFIVLLIPLTAQTRGLINERIIAAMKPTAFLINLARGNVVDEAALLDALRQRRIAGAALDVFSTEPLPADHPFWSIENVIVTPHTAGDTWQHYDQLVPLVADNLRAFLDGSSAYTNLVAR